jgi:hypothetical protein
MPGFLLEAFVLGLLLWGLLFWSFCLCFEAFAFWLFDGEGFWYFGILVWEALEEKRIAEGELLKGNC